MAVRRLLLRFLFVRWDLRKVLWLLWVVGQQQRLTDCWLCSREKQEVGGQLKELKDQLEAEQYFTVILNNKLPLFSFPPERKTANSNGEEMFETGQSCQRSSHLKLYVLRQKKKK